MNESLISVPSAEWPGLARFIVDNNRRPGGAVHCLHAAHGDGVASHAAELAALPAGEAAFWVLRDGAAMVGLVGCEFDPALRRAWMRGPLCSRAQLLDAMLPLVATTLEAALPEIDCFDAFPAADSEVLNAWYGAAGYTPLQLHRELRATIVMRANSAAVVRRATAGDVPAALALHEALFPSPYLGAADFHRAVDGSDCALWVAGNDGASPAGYLYVQDDAAQQRTYVDYLGVAPSQRGRGLGRALLDAAAAWGAQHGRSEIALIVREDRDAALGLYRQAGFVEVSAGRHWRKHCRQSLDLRQ